MVLRSSQRNLVAISVGDSCFMIFHVQVAVPLNTRTLFANDTHV
jgi:hypothetical protein